MDDFASAVLIYIEEFEVVKKRQLCLFMLPVFFVASFTPPDPAGPRPYF